MMKIAILAVLLAAVALSVEIEADIGSAVRASSCPCKCLTKKGAKRRAYEVCGRSAFVRLGCEVSKCRNSKNRKGFECCDGPIVPTPTPEPVSPCPCKCKGGPRAFKKARKACKKLGGLCKVTRCSKNKFKRWECCDV